MGGLGSGRVLGWQATEKIDGLLDLDIRLLKKRGLLKPNTAVTVNWGFGNGRSSSIQIQMASSRDSLALSYYVTRAGAEHGIYQVEVIQLTTTPCHLGGYRNWFFCPKCDRRCEILYTGMPFRCRECHNLSYASQSESKKDRGYRRARKINKRLGGNGSIFPVHIRPKGMHHSTFMHLSSILWR